VSDDRYPWYPWYVADYRASRRVQSLSIVQRGIYRELLDECWVKGFISDDVVELARICAISVSLMERHWPAVRTLFVQVKGVDGGFLTSERLERERAQIDKRRAQAADAGRRSAAARNGRSTTVQRPSTNTAQHNTTQALVTQAAELPRPHTGPVRTAADWKRLLDKPDQRGGADVS
jgi:uncharacterized protein YdaU (DUF1376 family)